MPTGRIISYPNVFQRQVGPLQLQDMNKPGHARFLTVSLVELVYRICSTRIVPPQQPSWMSTAEKKDTATESMDLSKALAMREELANFHTMKEMELFESVSSFCCSVCW